MKTNMPPILLQRRGFRLTLAASFIATLAAGCGDLQESSRRIYKASGKASGKISTGEKWEITFGSKPDDFGNPIELCREGGNNPALYRKAMERKCRLRYCNYEAGVKCKFENGSHKCEPDYKLSLRPCNVYRG